MYLSNCKLFLFFFFIIIIQQNDDKIFSFQIIVVLVKVSLLTQNTITSLNLFNIRFKYRTGIGLLHCIIITI